MAIYDNEITQALPGPIRRLFDAAMVLAHLYGQYQGAGLDVPQNVSASYQKSTDRLWKLVQRHYGTCTCDRPRVECPSYDVHSELWIDLEIAEEVGVETGRIVGAPQRVRR